MRKYFLTAMALTIAGPLFATDTAPAEDDVQIIVTGEAERKQMATEFVRALTVLNGKDPIAKFDKITLCPGVVGLKEVQNDAIATRMRSVAAAVNIPLAETPCRPNVLVIIADNKDEMLKALRKAHPAFFYNASNQPIVIPKQKGPATVWHLQALIDRDGALLPYDVETGRYTLVSSGTPSRITSEMRPIVVGSVVIIERESLIGLTTTQVGDYAAMRGFTEANPAKLKDVSAPTILTILDSSMDSEIPITMTSWDLAFLRGLYRTADYYNGRIQRREIQSGMIKEMNNADNVENVDGAEG